MLEHRSSHPYPFVWRPEPSKGPYIGLVLGGAGGLCTVVLVAALGSVEVWPAGLALGAVAVCAAAMAAVGFLGAWRVSSLRYVWSPGALEIRSGGAHLRVRYGQIDRIAAGPPDVGLAPALWPGAHFGHQLVERGPRYVWRATSRDADHLVAVEAGRVCYVLSPREADAFRRALIARAVAAPAESLAATRADVEGLDRVARVDGWIRLMLVAAIVLASVLLRADLFQSGAPQPDTLAALAVLGLNAALGVVLSRRALGVARLLVGVALALEVLAVLW
jgi:hypothetical protein